MDFAKSDKKIKRTNKNKYLTTGKPAKWSKKITKTSGFCMNSVLIIKKTL